jgi:hypothetical protein
MEIDFYTNPYNMTWIFDNGYTVSICYGPGAYGASEDNPTKKAHLLVFSADVMVTKKGMNVTKQFFPKHEEEDLSQGWVDVENLVDLLAKVKAQT